MNDELVLKGAYLEAMHVDADGVWYGDVSTGGVNRLSPSGKTDRWLPDRQLIGGILRTADGAMLASGSDGIAWFDPKTNATGMLLNAIDGAPICVNEMTPDGEGGIYFGTTDVVTLMAGGKPKPSALYRLYADGRVVKLVDGLRFSNGIGLSPDRKRLYHCETFVGVFAYDLAPGDKVTGSKQFLDKWDADGLAVDRDGNVWICGCESNEFLCLSPDGAEVRRVTLPGEGSTNLRFAGDDNRDAYFTTVTTASVEGLKKGVMPKEGSTIHRTRWDVAGKPLVLPRFKLS